MPIKIDNKLNQVVYVTGTNGYIGSNLLGYLKSKDIICKVRGQERQIHVYGEEVDSFNGDEMSGASVVIHLAGMTNYKKNDGLDEKSAHELINVTQTKNLLIRASNQGVKRFIYISTIKVHGEHSSFGKKFSVLDEPSPKGAYATSKYAAELKLQELANKLGVEFIIIRSPMVYGPLSPGNFMSLVRLVGLGIPLPFANFNNRRSMIYIGNLIKYIYLCIDNERVCGKTILVSDGSDLPFNQLVLAIGNALGKKAVLFSMPPRVIALFLGLLRLRGVVDRLVMPLEVEIQETTAILGWRPEIGTLEGIIKSLDGDGIDCF
jgi:nucleoside-diphosphate-sugar epimerase